mgnify:CR=1 FL=1
MGVDIVHFESKSLMQRRRDEFDFLKERSKLIRDIGMQNFRRVTASFESNKIAGVQLRGCTPNMAAITSRPVKRAAVAQP